MKKTKRKTTKKATDWPQYDLRFDPDEFRKKLRIDKHALDEEVERQPEIYGEVADAAIIAKSQVDSLEQQIKELESEIDTRIRKDADSDEERITENQIRNIVAGNKERKKLVIKLLNARNQQMRLDALQTAFRHKSYALRDMVDLYLSSYYTSRSAHGAQEDQKDAEVDRISTKMGERRQGRTKRNRKRTPK